MKTLITIIAAVMLVGCGESQQSTSAPEAKPEAPTGKAPDISIHDAAGARGRRGNIEAVKQHLAAGTDVDARDAEDKTPLQHAVYWGPKEIVALLIAKGADVNANDNAGETSLHWAVVGGKKEIVAALINNGANVNAKNDEGETPLDFAPTKPEIADLLSKHGGKTGGELPPATLLQALNRVDLEGIKDLLAKGADVNAKDDDGGTPLLIAVTLGNKEIAALLIANGADVNAKDPRGTTPLHGAALRGHKEIVKLLIAKGADVNAKSVDGFTSLHRVVGRGHKEIVELLIANGADVNAKGNYGLTPLLLAALQGHKEVAELLIAKGADVNAKVASGPKQGLTPLDAANETNHPEIADLLRKHGGKTGEESKPVEPIAEATKPTTPTKAPDVSIHTAATLGNIETVKQLIANGADVNAKGGVTGGTPLLIAVTLGHKEIAEQLIANGADVNAKDPRGTTPLHGAALRGHKEIAELLIAKGVDVNAKNEQGWTALHWAAHYGREEIAELLIAKGVDVNAKKDGGETPLDTAIRRKKPEVADLLRKHGGKTATVPDTPFTIHHAAEAGSIKTIKQHLVDGVDVNVKDPRGMTPLHFATGWDHKESVELLIDADADVNAKDDEGRTPLDLAIRNSNWSHVRRKRTEIAALLRKHGGKTGEWLKAGESIHIAARVGHIEAVKHHLAAGTDVNAKDEDGKTPLDHAEAEWEGDVDEVNAARNEVADLLRKHGGKTTRPNISIHDAAGARGRKGNIEAVKQHLAAGTDVDARDKEDKTPLKHAAFRGYKEIVELLIAKGADVNAKDEDGRTALDWAHGETADLLRKHGGKTGAELKAEGK
jgi:ankyrin repeat protein